MSGVSAVFGTLERVRRVLAIEKEHLEDLVAEGKAKHVAGRRQTSRGVISTSGTAASPVARVRAA